MAFERINNMYFMADSQEDLQKLPEVKMGTECFVIKDACEYKVTSDGEWINQTAIKNSQGSGSTTTAPDLSNYVTKEQLDQVIADSKINTTFGESEEIMASNPGSAFGIALNSGDTTSIVDAMLSKGIGLYTFWIHKSNPDLPQAAIDKKSSCRGLCCVDTVKDTGWYGWIQLFDHDGFMYTRYIRNSTPTEWRSC